MAATSKNIHLTPSEADALDIDFGNLRTASSMSIRSDNDTVINTEINSNEKPGASPRINLTEKTGTNDGVNIILPNITFPSTNLTLKNKRKRTEDNNQDEENQAKKGKLLIPDEYKDDYTAWRNVLSKEVRYYCMEMHLRKYLTFGEHIVPRSCRLNSKPLCGAQDPQFMKIWTENVQKCERKSLELHVEYARQMRLALGEEAQKLKSELTRKMGNTDTLRDTLTAGETVATSVRSNLH